MSFQPEKTLVVKVSVEMTNYIFKKEYYNFRNNINSKRSYFLLMKKHKNKEQCLCKLSRKEIDKNLKEISILLINPKFLCSKCARSSNVDSVLCHPQAIHTL